MKQNHSQLTFFAIITTVTVLFWVGMGVYQRLTTKDLQTIPATVLLPLNPQLNEEALQQIESRRLFSTEEIANFAPKKSTPEATRGSVASTSGEVSP